MRSSHQPTWNVPHAAVPLTCLLLLGVGPLALATDDEPAQPQEVEADEDGRRQENPGEQPVAEPNETDPPPGQELVVEAPPFLAHVSVNHADGRY
ncbi:MAG: hypothetical protein AAF961_10010, partial [Planctomycetota bacterium]